jgi:hypothetical protein
LVIFFTAIPFASCTSLGVENASILFRRIKFIEWYKERNTGIMRHDARLTATMIFNDSKGERTVKMSAMIEPV